MRTNSATTKQEFRGQSILEVAVGMLILIPIVLAILDLVVLVLGQEANNDLAKRAARAASHYATDGQARTAADQVINSFQSSKILTNPTKAGFQYNVNGNVVVETSLQVNLPVPVPFTKNLNNQVMRARATEPIVSLPAE
jgi:Flp pilus assembly protein TadG